MHFDNLPTKSSAYREFESIGQEICKKFYAHDLKTFWKQLAVQDVFKKFINANSEYDADDVLDSLMGFAAGCGNSGLLLAIGSHCFAVGTVFKNFRTENSTIEEQLERLIQGSVVAGFAATEPQAGSDVMAMTTSFEKKSHYILNGEKCYITNAMIATEFVILATSDSRLHARGISAFWVLKDTPGLKVLPNDEILGLKQAFVGTLQMNSVEIPLTHLVGKQNHGAQIFRMAMSAERVLLQAFQVGLMRKFLEVSLSFVNQRKQFSQSIGSHQLVLDHVVTIYEKYLTSYCLIRDSVKKLYQNQLTDAQASLTKLYISESALSAHLALMRIMAGKAYVSNYSVESNLLDIYGGIIYSGTSEIQKIIIGADLGLI